MSQASALNSLPNIPAIGLPRSIQTALATIGRRLRWNTILGGVGSILLFAVAVMSVGMAVDFAFALPLVVRLAIWGVWVATIAWRLSSTIRRSLSQGRSATALYLAAVIERKFPSVGERLTASVGLVREGRVSHGSPALIAALVDQAAEQVAAINPAEAVSTTSATRRFTLGMIAVILLGTPLLLVPDPLGKLASRFLNPWADLGRISRIKIIVEPGNAYAAIGDDFAVSAELAARFGPAANPESVWLEWTDPATKRTRRVAMNPPDSASKRRTAVIPSLAESLNYRVVTASAESDRFTVTAVEPPKIAKLAVKVVPPAYTKRPAAEVRDPSRFDAFELSRVELTVTSGSRIKAVELFSPKAGGEPEEMNRTLASVGSDGLTGKVSFFAETSGPFSVRLHDPRGIGSRPEAPRRINVVPDTAPTVDLQGIDGLTESTAADTLRVGVLAGDDVAVASVELHYKIMRQESQSDIEIGKVDGAIKGLGTETAKGVVALGLRSLKLQPGDMLSYRVRVADNRPAPRGPNVTWSSDHDLKIVAQAESMASKRGGAERSAIQERLDAFKKAITDTKKETEQLRYAADAAQRENGKWEADRKQSLVQQEAEARRLTENLQQFADELKENPAYHPLARPAEELAHVEGEALQASLDRARQTDDPAKRFNALQKADNRAGEVARKIDELKAGFDALNQRGHERDRLQDLADRQNEIAEKAEASELNPHDRLAFDKLQAEQSAVKKDLDQLLQKSPELRAELLKTQAEEAKGLVEKAKALAEHQRDEAGKATNLLEKSTQEKLRELAQEQRALENEARRFGLDINQALGENGRSPVNTEPLKRAIEPIERGDIGEGRDTLRQAAAELQRVARDIEDAPRDTKALAQRLFNAEQVLTNDLAQMLGEHRNKTEIPAKARAEANEALKRLHARAEDVARLASAIPESKDALATPPNGVQPFPRDLAVKAADSAKRAAEQLRLADNPKAMEKEAGDARDALGALANALPNHWQVEGDRRKPFDEARNKTDAAANEVVKHLGETDRPADGQKAVDDLVNRLAPLVDQAKQAAEQLGKVETSPRNEASKNLAADRAKDLADEIKAAREALAQHPGAKEVRAIRDHLGMAVLESKAATERVNQGLAGNPTDEKLADALAAEANELKPGDAAEANRMASAIRNVQALDAPIELAEAVRAVERAASAPADPPESAKTALKELADRLNGRQSPRAAVEALARAERSSAQERDPAAAAKLQRTVAAELAGLPLNQAENQAAMEAVQRAEAVAEAVAKPAELGENPRADADLAQAQNQAAKALDALAATLPNQPANLPKAPKERPGKDLPPDRHLELNAENAKIAADLAVRERHLAERLQGVLGERAQPQQALKREAVALSRDLASLRDRVQAVSDRARWPAQEAASLLGEHAPPAMNEAANQLALGQKDRAKEMQRQAADLAERAARSTEDMANALLAEKAALDAQALADAANAPTPEQGPLQGEALAKARDAMNRAAASLQQARTASASKGDSAKQALREAAKTLQAAAESQVQAQETAEPRMTTRQAGTTKDPKGREITKGTTETLTDLKALVQKKTGRNWGELPGHLRSEILEMARQPRYRDDYARLIQLYFRDIAAGAK